MGKQVQYCICVGERQPSNLGDGLFVNTMNPHWPYRLLRGAEDTLVLPTALWKAIPVARAHHKATGERVQVRRYYGRSKYLYRLVQYGFHMMSEKTRWERSAA